MAPLKWNLIFIFCFVVRKMTFFLWKASKLLRIRSNSEESLCRTEWSRSSSREDSVKIIYDVCSWHVLLSKPSSPKWNVYWWRRCGRSLCECDYRERGLSWLKHWDVSETLRREQQLLVILKSLQSVVVCDWWRCSPVYSADAPHQTSSPSVLHLTGRRTAVWRGFWPDFVFFYLNSRCLILYIM